jgi:hypothetical protein
MAPLRGHGCVWSQWSDWQDMGNGQELRERHCLVHECGEVQTQTRRKR